MNKTLFSHFDTLEEKWTFIKEKIEKPYHISLETLELITDLNTRIDLYHDLIHHEELLKEGMKEDWISIDWIEGITDTITKIYTTISKQIDEN